MKRTIFPYPPELVRKFAGDSLVQEVQVRDGDPGVEDALGFAKKDVEDCLLDSTFPLWVREIVLNGNVPYTEPQASIGEVIDPSEHLKVFSACYDLLKNWIGFQPDPLALSRAGSGGRKSITDYVQGPHYTFFRAGFGDCLAHAIAACSLSVSLGHGAKIRVLRGTDPTDPTRLSHVYAMLGSPRTGWVPLDDTNPLCGFAQEIPGLAKFDPHDVLIADLS